MKSHQEWVERQREILIELKKGNNGLYPSFSSYGSYPFIYFLADESYCCADCANGLNGSDVTLDNDDKDRRLMAMDTYWEGSVIQCTMCDANIESAYGDPDSELNGDQDEE
jgi:hypothetical protein